VELAGQGQDHDRGAVPGVLHGPSIPQPISTRRPTSRRSPEPGRSASGAFSPSKATGWRDCPPGSAR
jgi:hypothetical protein